MAKLYGGQHQGLLNRSASSRNLLTGFLKCGLCGGNLVIVTGRQRRHAMYGCPQHFYRSTCSNDLKVRQEWLEKELLSDLQQAILQPEAIDYALQEFQRHLDSVLVSSKRSSSQKRLITRYRSFSVIWTRFWSARDKIENGRKGARMSCGNNCSGSPEQLPRAGTQPPCCRPLPSVSRNWRRLRNRSAKNVQAEAYKPRSYDSLPSRGSRPFQSSSAPISRELAPSWPFTSIP